ncbi:putative IS1 encoded protein [Shigella dysenteriae 225-75]|nr:putative IS1 encoded protein [Shigella dysenteriae 225-75]
MPCFTAMRAEIALMSDSAFAVTHHAFSSGAGRTSDENGSHASTLKSPSYTKCKRAARTVLTGMCYSVGSATRQGSSSPTRFIGQSAMTSST